MPSPPPPPPPSLSPSPSPSLSHPPSRCLSLSPSHLRARGPDGLAEELEVVEVGVDVAQHVHGRRHLVPRRVFMTNPGECLSHIFSRSLYSTNL